jgi:CubicO group peptidase (beta-lactamase class C family)
MNVSLAKIETVAQKAIDGKMAPGMQILVARKEKLSIRSRLDIRLMKKTNVTNTDLYDVASLTKILSTLPNVVAI